MAALSGGEDDEMISGINVTPLVDITLVLLIIFMVTATYIVKESIEVDLPRAANAGQSVGTTLTVVLTAGGEIYLDGIKRTEGELKTITREAVKKDKDSRAIISADQKSFHGAVVHLIDLVKGEGVSKFAINIEKEAAPAPQR